MSTIAKIKYNVKGVDPGGDRAVPKAGIYRCKVTSCIDAKPADKDRRLELKYEIQSNSAGEKDNKGYVLFDYIPFTDTMDWKMAQFIKAMGLPESGAFDPDEIVGTGLNVRVRIQPETEQYAASAKPATLMPLDGDEDDGEDLSEGGEEAEDGEGEEETYTEEELNELEKDDLFAIAEELIEDFTKPKRFTAAGKTKLIAAILEAQGEDDDEEGEEEEGELWTEEELTELDDDALKGVAFGDPEDEEDEGFELDPDDYVTKKKNPKTKKMVTKFDRDGLIAAILEAQGDDEGEDEGEGEEGDDEPLDYDSMELADLKALAKERKLDQKGPKKLLVARLKKDDDPF